MVLLRTFEVQFFGVHETEFCIPGKTSHVIFTIMIPTQLTESKYEAQKNQNHLQEVLSQNSLITITAMHSSW
jgi:hypothetical protein